MLKYYKIYLKYVLKYIVLITECKQDLVTLRRC
jgi:hypothetical protein